MTLELLSQVSPLYRRVTMVQWCVLAITVILETLALQFLPASSPLLRIEYCIAALTLLAVLSIYRCEQKSYAVRIAIVSVELFLTSLAFVSGVSRWSWPLYLVLIARASLLLRRRHLWLLVVVSFLIQSGWYAFKFLGGQTQQIWGPNLAASLLAALMMTSTYGALMVAVASLMFALLSEQELRLQTEALDEENKRLAAELERTRIARELHDTLGHSLTALKIQLELAGRLFAVDDSRAASALAQAEALAGRSLIDTRVALQSIRNADFDFSASLTALLEEVRSSAALTVHVDLTEQSLPNVTSYQLFRVAQECLTNAIKHSGATDVFVVLRSDGREVELSIRDNGRGFTGGGSSDGFGLKGLRERIASLQGRVEIDSGPDHGTTVKAFVPAR